MSVVELGEILGGVELVEEGWVELFILFVDFVFFFIGVVVFFFWFG